MPRAGKSGSRVPLCIPLPGTRAVPFFVVLLLRAARAEDAMLQLGACHLSQDGATGSPITSSCPIADANGTTMH